MPDARERRGRSELLDEIGFQQQKLTAQDKANAELRAELLGAEAQLAIANDQIHQLCDESQSQLIELVELRASRDRTRQAYNRAMSIMERTVTRELFDEVVRERDEALGDIAERGDEYARLKAETGTFNSAKVGTVMVKGTDEWHELNLKQLLDQEYTRGYRTANTDHA